MKKKLVVVALSSLLGLGLGIAPRAMGADKKPKMAEIIFQDDQFFRLVLFGARDAAKTHDIDLREGNSENKLDKEKRLVDTYVTSKVDAILISPLSKKASAETIKHAKERGVVVIVENTPVDGDYQDAAIQSDDHDLGFQTGQSAAKYIQDHLGGKAKVAILAFKSQVPEQSNARTSGFKDGLKSVAGLDVEIVAEQDAWLAEMAVKKAGDILTAHPDLNVIFAANDGGTIGSTIAVKNAGKAGKVAVFGTDVGEQMLSFLKSPDNILQATTAQRPFEAGQKAVELALKVMKHEPVEKMTILKGVNLSRTNMPQVEEYEKQLKEWMSKG